MTWTDVPFGTSPFDANGPTAGVISNHATAGDFTDELSAVLTFDLVTAADGSQTLQANADITTALDSVGSFNDFRIVAQAQFAGRLPVTITGFNEGGTFSAGAINADGELEIDASDLPGLTFTPDEHFSGQTQVLVVEYNGVASEIPVDIVRVADAPTVTTMDQSGDSGTVIDISTAVSTALVDADGSETITLVELNNIPIGHTVSDGSNSFTAAAGNQAVDVTVWDLSALTYETPDGTDDTFPIGVRAVTTDMDGFTADTEAGLTAETTATFNVDVITDTDSDGVRDSIDVDDDNDGILDVLEGREVLQVQGELLLNGVDDNGRDRGLNLVEFGGTPALSDVIASAEDIVVGPGLTILTEPDNDRTSLFELDLADANSATFAEAVAADDFVELSFTTQDVQSSLRLLFHSFTAQDAQGSNRGDYRVTYLISDDGFATSDVLIDDQQFQPGASGDFNGQFPDGFEEYDLDGNTRYSVRAYVYDAQNDRAGEITFNDQFFQFNQIIEQDTDGDGIVNRLDIDSDNDGITDNIEAQSTADYIAPSGIEGGITDLNQDGLDDNFDSRTVVVGDSAATQNEALITPVDTDSDDTPDFLDTNSDNEGGNDTAEAGLTGTATGLSTDATDADGDGLFDVFETQGGTDASDGFNVNESLNTGAASLPDADGDAAGGVPLSEDVDFRDVPTPPVLDLNSTASEGDADRGFSSTFVAGNDAISIVDLDADALEGSDVQGFTYLTITPSSALPDGANEILTIAGVDIPLNADSVQSGVTIPGTSTVVDISFRDGVITVREQSNGAISNADMDALIRSVTYRNEAASLDDSVARTFDFQVAQFDPATFVIDFEELTPGTSATAEQIGSDPYWSGANPANLNGLIQDADNAGEFNQNLADNADGTFLFHNTGGNVPNDQRIVFGADDIPVEANQDYILSIDIGRQNQFSAGPFEVLINGTSIGLINVNSGPVQDWQTLTFNFNSGDTDTVELQLRNTSTNSTGNDFGIDNITFQT